MKQTQFHGLSEYDRLLKWIEVAGPNDCWNWKGSRITSGTKKIPWHGQWRNGSGENELAHRGAYRLLKGAIPEKMCVLHSCDNPICCNPSHLWIGTQSDNLKDMWAKGRARPMAHLGEAHGGAKLTEDLVRDIRRSTESGVELARRLNMTPTTICDIRKRRTWKHIV